MLLIATVGHDHAALQGQDTDLALGLETIVMSHLIRQRGRDELWWLVKPFVAFLGHACLAVCRILLDLCPQRLVGATDLPWDGAGHLGRELVACSQLGIRPLLQPHFVAHLLVFKSVARHIVQAVTVRQLRGSQGGELLRGGRQFELGRDGYLHASSIAWVHQMINLAVLMNGLLCLRPARLSSPRLKSGASRRELVNHPAY